MSSRDVDLEELLNFQQKFIIHAENIQVLAKQLNNHNEAARDVLRDDVSKKSIQKIKEISIFIENMSAYIANEMKKHEGKTRREIEEFRKL